MEMHEITTECLIWIYLYHSVIAQQQLLFYLHETFIIFLIMNIQKINNQNTAKQPPTNDQFVPIMHILCTYKTIKSF